MKKELTVEKKAYYGSLLAIYGNMLTENIRRRMESFFFEDYSISEIAENENVSRNAVFESIEQGEKQLDKYEEGLKMKERSDKILSLLEQVKPLDEESRKKVEEIKGEINYGI